MSPETETKGWRPFRGKNPSRKPEVNPLRGSCRPVVLGNPPHILCILVAMGGDPPPPTRMSAPKGKRFANLAQF